MTLNELMKPYRHIRLATADDNSELIELYESQAMKSGGLTLKYTRKGDFFRFIKQQGRKHYTFLFCNNDGSIGGVASYVITDGSIEGNAQPMAYMCDARVARNADRETKQEWRRFYVDSVTNSHRIEEFENCEYMYSAILDANKIALKAFIKEDSPLEFHPTQNYQAIQVLGKKWLGGAKSKYTARSVAADEITQLKEFLKASNKNKFIGTSEQELQRRETDWSDFNYENFQVVEDDNNQWLAVCAPTSFTNSRSLMVEKASFSAIMLSKFAILFGGPTLKENEDLKTTYLTHLEFAAGTSKDVRLWCIRAFVDALFKSIVTKKGNLLSFVLPVGIKVSKHPALSRYLMQVTKGTYYQVYPKSRKNDLKRFSQLKDIAFEIALA